MKLKNFRRSKKALSPVVASIILIAVTVAVSIAVAVWMGALTTGFMSTEQVTITSAVFGTNNANVVLTVSNTGTNPVLISQVWVGTTQVASPAYAGNFTAAGSLPSNGVGTITITMAFTSGNNYAFKLVTKAGNTYGFNAVAP